MQIEKTTENKIKVTVTLELPWMIRDYARRPDADWSGEQAGFLADMLALWLPGLSIRERIDLRDALIKG